MKKKGKRVLALLLAVFLVMPQAAGQAVSFAETAVSENGDSAGFEESVSGAENASKGDQKDRQAEGAEGAEVETVKREYILTAQERLRHLALPSWIADITFADDCTALVTVKGGMGGVDESDIRKCFSGKAAGLLVQPNYVYEAERVNDPYFSLQWGLHNSHNGIDIRFDESFDYLEKNLTKPQKTVVAVIDTGIDYTHPDLEEHIWKNTGEISGNGIDDDRNGYIDDVHGYNFTGDTALRPQDINSEYAHGTHCAGTVGAACGNGIGIAGIGTAAESVFVMDLKVLAGKNGTGSTFDLIRAISYAEENGADICNLSMGSYADDKLLYKAISASGMLFVCAAGNDGANLDFNPVYPGCYELSNVICVGNSKSSGSLNGLSNYSERYVDIAAPGTDIYSTLPSGRYGNMSGTSMAAPFVSGAAAVLHSYYEDISAAEMRFLLLDGAISSKGLIGKVAGSRFLDLYKPLTAYRDEDFQIDEKAPSLNVSMVKIKGSYKQKLSVKSKDDSGRKPEVRYAKGSQSLTWFRSGMGTRMSLTSSGSGTKTLSVPGTYTVYTRDAAGNDRIAKVKCTADAVSSLHLNYSKKTIARGKTYTLKATLSKSGKYGRKLTWTTSDQKVASVSSSGKVTARKKGTAVITVKTGNGLAKKCKITVK